jgi:hypothetical protein
MSNGLTVYANGYLTPTNYRWVSLVAGTPGSTAVQGNMPAAMALTDDELLLCGEQGPFFAIPLIAIQDVAIVKFDGLTLSINTSAGIVRAVPRHNFGLEITYESISSIKRLRVLTLFADCANEWIEAIGAAIDDLTNGSHEQYRPRKSY